MKFLLTPDGRVTIGVAILTLFFLSLAVMNWHSERLADTSRGQGLLPGFSSAEAIGNHAVFLGKPSNSYTLVEFGDYQCPPCREQNRELHDVMTKYHDKIRFTFRNLPLTNIHPLAMTAAIIAEEARTEGDFWAVHDILYSGENLNDTTLAKARAVIVGNDQRRRSLASDATGVVKVDMADAKRLGIRETPTFILCSPSNKLYCIHSLLKLDQVLSN